MIIKSIYIKEGIYSRIIEFSSGVNIIHSKKNSQGKTTLLRLLLYGLGYSVPSTRNIDFSNCDVQIDLITDSGMSIILNRYDSSFIESTIDGKKSTYVLPSMHNDLLSIIFAVENHDILENALGAYYVDQEKGWTLLNRGIVIGKIGFSIESLVRGLSENDCSELIKQEKNIDNEYQRLKKIFKIAEYRDYINQQTNRSIVQDNYDDKNAATLDRIKIEKNDMLNEIRRIDKTLSENKKIKRFISEMKLIVIDESGNEILVTDNNILGLNDSIEYLKARKKVVSRRVQELDNEQSRLIEQMPQKKEMDQQSSFFNNNSFFELDNAISMLNLDSSLIENEIERLKNERARIREEISELTKTKNTVAPIINETIMNYYEEIGLGDKDSIPASYLFTKNLKVLSGAVLTKTAFIFRLAYIKAIESVTNVKFPIILDSPRGKEVDNDNVKRMMDILYRDFSDHQIIIASIYDFDFPKAKIIEIEDRLINEIDTSYS